MVAEGTGQSTRRSTRPEAVMIGTYTVLGSIGAGGMARVWKVKNSTGAIRALKEMKPQSEAKREMNRRFQQEFEVTRLIEHRNVVRVHDFFPTAETLNIVMELVDGPDVRSMMRWAGLPDSGRLALLGSEIASGLAAAHAKGVLHRDLKPENVLISRRGQVKVTDFGVARVEGTRLTATGIIVGSPAYMSPEQLAGVGGQDLTPTSDIYALGVTLYELGEGRDPLGLRKHEDLLSVLRAKRERRPRRFRYIVDEDLQILILRCLEPEEDARPETMEAVARELRRIARRHGAVRADLEFLVTRALERQAAGGRKPKLAPAPPRPVDEAPVPLAAPDDGRGSRPPAALAAPSTGVGPRLPRVPRRTAPGAPASVGPLAPQRAAQYPSGPPDAPRGAPWSPGSRTFDGADPEWRQTADFGGGERHSSRVGHLSVGRGRRPSEPASVLAWATVIVVALAVVFLGASASLTGSPLGLIEQFVPVP